MFLPPFHICISSLFLSFFFVSFRFICLLFLSLIFSVSLQIPILPSLYFFFSLNLLHFVLSSFSFSFFPSPALFYSSLRSRFRLISLCLIALPFRSSSSPSMFLLFYHSSLSSSPSSLSLFPHLSRPSLIFLSSVPVPLPHLSPLLGPLSLLLLCSFGHYSRSRRHGHAGGEREAAPWPASLSPLVSSRPFCQSFVCLATAISSSLFDGRDVPAFKAARHLGVSRQVQNPGREAMGQRFMSLLFMSLSPSRSHIQAHEYSFAYTNIAIYMCMETCS